MGGTHARQTLITMLSLQLFMVLEVSVQKGHVVCLTLSCYRGTWPQHSDLCSFYPALLFWPLGISEGPP